MRYYFGPPSQQLIETDNYIELFQSLMKDYYVDLTPALVEQYKLFLLESCRFYVDGFSTDNIEKLKYYELVKSAYDNLLIHKDKIEACFKEYINDLFSAATQKPRSPPQNISELLIEIMLSELNMKSILKHVNLGTQEIDLQSIRDSTKLERINGVKRLHDRVLFFIEFYNGHAKKV